VAQLMLGGHSSKAIAQRLQISVETVRVHKKHLYSKLGINSQSELFSVFLRASRAKSLRRPLAMV
jgi:DNA-binding CsgD family transcriptional regulator